MTGEEESSEITDPTPKVILSRCRWRCRFSFSQNAFDILGKEAAKKEEKMKKLQAMRKMSQMVEEEAEESEDASGGIFVQLSTLQSLCIDHNISL